MEPGTRAPLDRPGAPRGAPAGTDARRGRRPFALPRCAIERSAGV